MADKLSLDTEAVAIKPLAAADFEAVIALDQLLSHHSRRGFFDKRWQAMARDPQAFVALGAYQGEVVCGFALGHVLQGEFGGTAPVVVLDALGVALDEQAQGVGHALIGRLVDTVRELGGGELRTQVAWDQSGLASFFARCGFRLAPRLVLERATGEATF
ncbi:MAG: GNAT family N-acetyltransferase [Gammaproteobacteria bacterium]|nr:GNAT family N-acetyltransferase [Gammaproteobacteria bacterium]